MPVSIISFIRELRAKNIVNGLELGRYYGRKKVPFVGQLESLKEDLYWAKRACGIANLAMVFSSEGVLGERKLLDLVEEGLSMDGYAFKNRQGKVDIGWKHKCLVDMCKKEGFKAWSFKKIGFNQLLEKVLTGSYMIASLKSKIGSHMVLINGFKVDQDRVIKLLVHNPYVLSKKGGKDVWYEHSLFLDLFLSKAVEIKV